MSKPIHEIQSTIKWNVRLDGFWGSWRNGSRHWTREVKYEWTNEQFLKSR